MKTDRELLELAAKAAGYKCVWSDSREGYYFGLGSYTPEYWDPLTTDSHAFRLAVKLDLCVTRGMASLPSDHTTFFSEQNDAITADPLSATRRAIVRAAADIGEKIVKKGKK